MKTLKRLSKKAIEFCELSGFDKNKVNEAMKLNSFAMQKCETKAEKEYHDVDLNYPYVIFNPFNITIN